MSETTQQGQFGLPQLMDKKFWSRPEGMFTKIFLGGLGVVFGIGVIMSLPAILAYISVITASMMSIAIHGAVLFGIGAVILNDDIRNSVSFGFRALMRNIAGAIYDISPIAVVRDYVEELKKSLGKMEVQIQNLKRQIASLQQLKERRKKEIEDSLERMSVAKKQSKEGQARMEAQMVGMRQKAVQDLERLLQKLEIVYRVLLKMREGAQFQISGTEQKVELTISQATAMAAGDQAVQEAIKIINGDPAKKRAFDHAMTSLATTTANAVADIDNFMEMSRSFFDGVDLENGVANERAMKMLEAWEKKVDASSVLGVGGKEVILSQAYNPNDSLDLDQMSTPATLPVGRTDIKDFFSN